MVSKSIKGHSPENKDMVFIGTPLCSSIYKLLYQFSSSPYVSNSGLVAKHNLADYSIKSAGQLAKKTLWYGKVAQYKKYAQSATWEQKRSVVTFVIDKGKILISNMWIF